MPAGIRKPTLSLLLALIIGLLGAQSATAVPTPSPPFTWSGVYVPSGLTGAFKNNGPDSYTYLVVAMHSNFTATGCSSSFGPCVISTSPPGHAVFNDFPTPLAPGSSVSLSINTSPAPYTAGSVDLEIGVSGGSPIDLFNVPVGATSLPRPEDFLIPKKVKVDSKSGKGQLPITPPSKGEELAGLSLNYAFHHRRGNCFHGSLNLEKLNKILFKLDRQCLEDLDRKGRITGTLEGTFSNAAGTVPFDVKLKLLRAQKNFSP